MNNGGVNNDAFLILNVFFSSAIPVKFKWTFSTSIPEALSLSRVTGIPQLILFTSVNQPLENKQIHNKRKLCCVTYITVGAYSTRYLCVAMPGKGGQHIPAKIEKQKQNP